MKITSEMVCKTCRQKITTKGKPFRGRRSNGVMFEDVYLVSMDLENEIIVHKGYRYYSGDEAEDVICSRKCVLAEVKKLLPKMKLDKDE